MDETVKGPHGVGPWFGGSKVRVRIPQTEETVVGEVNGGTGYGRTRILVEGDSGEKDTEILIPNARVLEVVER